MLYPKLFQLEGAGCGMSPSLLLSLSLSLNQLSALGGLGVELKAKSKKKSVHTPIIRVILTCGGKKAQTCKEFLA